MTEPKHGVDAFEQALLASAKGDGMRVDRKAAIALALGAGAGAAVTGAAGAAKAAGVAGAAATKAKVAGSLLVMKWLAVAAVGGAVVVGATTLRPATEPAVPKTNGAESPRVVLGVQLDGDDYEFAFRVHGASAGIDLHIKMDLATGKLRVNVKGGTYDVEVQRIGDAGVGTFTHKGVRSDADVFYFDYQAWKGNGTPMQVEVDRGGDGSVDATQSLSDED